MPSGIKSAWGASVIVRLCAFLCVLAVLASTELPAAASEPRVALVIGNSEYGPAIGKLKNPANDAKLMAETLKGLGFSVDLVLDADQKAMKRAIKGFGAKLKDAGSETTGLFYYAGHGVQVEGTNFLLPVDAEIATEADVEIESVSADDVVTQMQFAGVAVNLVFLDACRNNPLARTSRSATRGLARLDAPRGSFVGYSTAPGDVAADGDGANSPYALALVQELKTPGISIEEAHRNVRAKVLAESGNKQTPWDSSSLTGAVVLVEKTPEPAPQPVVQAAPAPQPQVQQQASVDKEVVFWESIKGSKDPAEFEAYLKKYPDGTFADLARAKIAGLEVPPPSQQVAAVPPPAVPDHEVDPNHVSPLPDGTIVLTKSVAAELQAYLQLNIAYGFFFVSLDGQSSGQATCQARGAVCSQVLGGASLAGAEISPKLKSMAESKCRTVARTDCVMLFHLDDKKTNYKMADPPELRAMGQIVIGAEAKAEIDGYLRNLSAGYASALVLAKNGTRTERGKCPRAQSPSTPEACREERPGGPEDKAAAIALARCGGPDDCILLYLNDRKVANLDIVVH